MDFIQDNQGQTWGLEQIRKYVGKQLGDSVHFEQLEKTEDIALRLVKGEENYIYYKDQHHFYRGVGLYLQFVEEGKKAFVYEEQIYIPKCGAMIDVSRNSVYKVDKLKGFLVKLAMMGYNNCMLYTEDTYTIEGNPYFGYLRGRYSKEELRELDSFAEGLGIELIPCIQTLAHLRQTLKWNYAQDMRDTADVLLVGADKTYAFIEEMLVNIKDTFKTNKIHIGMDEAWDLGRGQSITKNGYKPHSELMIEHLEKVNELMDKYHFEPMIWDDMFLRFAAPDVDHYDMDSPLDPKVVEGVPSNLSLVHWDYYHNDKDFYVKTFHKLNAFKNNLIFAGGVWKWNGYAPNYDKTFITTHAALAACREEGIKEVVATMWGDDGDETPLDTTLLGLILFSEYCYQEIVEDEWLNRRCQFLTGLEMEAFRSLEEIDTIPGVQRPNVHCTNPSKYLLYQDVLLGAFDYYVMDQDLYGYYVNLADKYFEYASRTEEYEKMFTFYGRLSEVLAIKSNIGALLYKVYQEKDQEALEAFAEEILPTLIDELTIFNESLRDLWFEECKGQGMEILDIRIGGIIQRCHTAIYRIEKWLDNPAYVIHELEEDRLPFKLRDIDHDRLPSFNHYINTASHNIFSHNI